MNGTGGNGPKPIASVRMLIGEGVEEVLFFEALLADLRISGVQVEHYGGKSGLAPYLKALRHRSGFTSLERLAITRDADEDAAGALTSVASAIAKAEFPADLKVSHFVLPGRSQPGALENLCLQTVSGTAIEQCIEDYLTCASRATGTAHTTRASQAKARVHAWLASQVEPDLRLGHAAKKGWLNWNVPAFDELKIFLSDLG